MHIGIVIVKKKRTGTDFFPRFRHSPSTLVWALTQTRWHVGACVEHSTRQHFVMNQQTKHHNAPHQHTRLGGWERDSCAGDRPPSFDTCMTSKWLQRLLLCKLIDSVEPDRNKMSAKTWLTSTDKHDDDEHCEWSPCPHRSSQQNGKPQHAQNCYQLDLLYLVLKHQMVDYRTN